MRTGATVRMEAESEGKRMKGPRLTVVFALTHHRRSRLEGGGAKEAEIWAG